MCGGGSGGGGTTQYNWNDDMAQHWKPALNTGEALAARLYNPYPGQRIADYTPSQWEAMQAITGFAGAGGSPATRAAGNQAQETLQGDYLDGQQQNPWTRQYNPFAGVGASTSRNQYAGDSPQFRSTLQTGLQDMTNAYQQGTAADTARMFTQSGTFGGSAHQNAVQNNEAGLARGMGSYLQNMQNDQYNRSAGLEQTYLNNDLQNSQFDLTRGGQLEENRLNRGMSAYEGERGRQTGAIGSGQNEQALALQRFNSVMGVGDVQRGVNQDILNQRYNDYQTAQQYPYNQMDWLTGLFGRAQGGMSPNSTTQTSGYSASPFSQILGAGLMGYGLSNR